MTDGFGSPAWRAFAGIRFSNDVDEVVTEPPADSDNDGIADASDACPLEPEDFDAFEDEDGCPDLDNDGDGVADVDDACPLEPEDIDAFEDEDGCAEERFWARAVFRVVDDEKKIISGAAVAVVEAGRVVAEGRTGEDGQVAFRIPSGSYAVKATAPAYIGTQAAVFFDKEKQGVQLTLDREETKGYLQVFVRDSEGRVVRGLVAIRPAALTLASTPERSQLDVSLAPGRYSLIATGEGYRKAVSDVTVELGRTRQVRIVMKPVPQAPRKVEVKQEKIEIAEQVRFHTGKATIDFDSYPLLDEIADVIKSNDQVRLIRIEGHTDSIGRDSLNLQLSQKRAQAVRDYLIARGVDGRRLEALGYGESRPIADNALAEGRAKNRRVEFMIIEDKMAGR